MVSMPNPDEFFKGMSSKDEVVDKLLNPIQNELGDLYCGGPCLAGMLKWCEDIRKIKNHLIEKHKDLTVRERIDNMIVDAIGINWKRFVAKTPDMCMCHDLNLGICHCPNQDEVDLVKCGRRMAALKAMKDRLKLTEILPVKKALDFYCP